METYSTTFEVVINGKEDGEKHTLTGCYFLEAPGVDYEVFVGAHRLDDSTF